MLDTAKHSSLVLFNSITKEASSIDVALEHSLLEATGKKLDKEKAYFDYFNKSCIWGFGNAWHQGYGKT